MADRVNRCDIISIAAGAYEYCMVNGWYAEEMLGLQTD